MYFEKSAVLLKAGKVSGTVLVGALLYTGNFFRKGQQIWG